MTWILGQSVDDDGEIIIRGQWSDEEIKNIAETIRIARTKYDIMQDADDIIFIVSDFLPQPLRDAI